MELDGKTVEGEFIELTDDGRDHTALFPPRAAMERGKGAEVAQNTEMRVKI